MSSSPEPDTDPRQQLLADEESIEWEQAEKIPPRRFPSCVQVTICFLAVAMLIVMAGEVGYHFQDCSSQCAKHVSQYSPLMRDMDVTYHVKAFNGSFLKENIYRRDASPEVDAAWQALGVNYRPLRVPPEDASKAGISSSHVRINEKYGGGYPAHMEGLHHLHCLNLLRQALYYNYDYYHAQGEGAFTNDDHVVRKHVSHCLDILRQQLMCTADVGVFGQVWVWPDEPRPFVDFNTRHQCKNYDQIRQWAHDHQLPENPPPDFIQAFPGKGAKVYPEIP